MSVISRTDNRLTPHAVLVHRQADGELRVLVGDWRSAGTVAGGSGCAVSFQRSTTSKSSLAPRKLTPAKAPATPAKA